MLSTQLSHERLTFNQSERCSAGPPLSSQCRFMSAYEFWGLVRCNLRTILLLKTISNDKSMPLLSSFHDHLPKVAANLLGLLVCA